MKSSSNSHSHESGDNDSNNQDMIRSIAARGGSKKMKNVIPKFPTTRQ